MSENTKSKMNVWAVLFVIALIVICGMGIYIYKISAEKQIEIDKTESLNNQITHLQARSDILEDTLNKISVMINEVMTNPTENTQEPVQEISGEESGEEVVVEPVESGNVEENVEIENSGEEVEV